jgi:hypothetical protein
MLSSKGIEIGSMMRALGFDYNLTSSNQHHLVRSFRAHDNTNENCSPELKNFPDWIVGLTELHEISIKNSNERNEKIIQPLNLHFLLVVEVIKLNRILDLLMTLDATNCDVQLIYGLAEIS